MNPLQSVPPVAGHMQQQHEANCITNTLATTTITNSTMDGANPHITPFQCEDCSALIPASELVHHIRSHWQMRVAQLEAQLKQTQPTATTPEETSSIAAQFARMIEQHASKPSEQPSSAASTTLPNPLDWSLLPQPTVQPPPTPFQLNLLATAIVASSTEPTRPLGWENEMTESKAVREVGLEQQSTALPTEVEEKDTDMLLDPDEDEADEDDVDEPMSVDELQAELDAHDPTDHVGWMKLHQELIARQNEEIGMDESMDLDRLMDHIAHPIQFASSHTASIPLEVLYENDRQGISEASEVLNNPDLDETALDEVLHQMDHIPESLRTLLEELLEQYNADDHPLKCCSVEEFHSMIDSHLHPSGGGEYEYVGKLVQQLESALELSQQELAKYMKSKELDFNEMGPFMIEQKRIKEELIKQRAILFPLESPLWQSCMNYLQKVRQCLDRDPVWMLPIDANHSSLAATAPSNNQIPLKEVLPEAKSDDPTASSTNIGLDDAPAATMDEVTAASQAAADADPSILLESNEIDQSDEDGLVDELLEELDEDRFGRYQWLVENLTEYERVRALGPDRPCELIWLDALAFLQTTSFIGEEVKETIKFLFTQPNFMVEPSKDVKEWSGWNAINLKSSDYSPLDSNLPLNRKFLRGFDALIDTLIELVDEFLEAFDQRTGDHYALCDSVRALHELKVNTELGQTTEMVAFTERLQTFEDRLNLASRSYEKPNATNAASAIAQAAVGVEEASRRAEHRRELLELYQEAQALLPALKPQRVIHFHQLLARRSVHFEQYDKETIIPRRNMEFLIREVLQDWENNLRNRSVKGEIDFTPEAIEAIHVAAEDFLIKQFDAAGSEMESMTRIFPVECGGCHRVLTSNDTKAQCEQCQSPAFYCQSEK